MYVHAGVITDSNIVDREDIPDSNTGTFIWVGCIGFHMGELTHLVDELREEESVTNVEEHGEVVGFDTDRGEYNNLSSEVVTILGRYDCELYVFPDDEFTYRCVAP